jgi:hypothetical protein
MPNSYPEALALIQQDSDADGVINLLGLPLRLSMSKPVDLARSQTSLRQGCPCPSLSQQLTIDPGTLDEWLNRSLEGLTGDLWSSCQGVQQGTTHEQPET